MSEQRTPNTTPQPDDLRAARLRERKRKRRNLMVRRTILVLSIVVLIALIATAVVLKIVADQKSAKGETVDFLAVKEILVEGDTRYTEEQIIEANKLDVGQSLLSVNKVTAHDNLTAAFPYLETVEVSNASFYTLRIRVTEVPEMAVVECDGGWMILGENNRALEQVSAEDIPADLVRIQGASFEKQEVGKSLLDERSLRITSTLVSAAKRYDLKNLTTVDMTSKTKIFLLLDERMQVVLGNETNLTTQVEVLVDTLPTLYRNNGEDASGRVDMLFYSDTDSTNDKVIYTPPEVLDRLNQTQQKPMAAVQMGEEWMTVNAKNVALELLPADYLPADLIQVLGATFEANPAVGKELLDKRSLAICTAVIDGAALHSDVTVAVLDMTDRTAITLRLSTGLRVLFGDSSALSTQMDALAGVLPAVWEEHGEDADGLLDMTSYGDEDDQNDEAVYKRSAN